MKKYVLAICLLGLCGCVTSKGTVTITENKEGQTIVSWASKTPFETAIETKNKEKVKIKTMKDPKPTPLDKVLDTLSMGAANRIMNSEEDKD